ncbi:hypothetical protein BG004_004396 [Podila humilis]|nr:hypothetical protein BG004_004396 [Podila humilis]
MEAEHQPPAVLQQLCSKEGTTLPSLSTHSHGRHGDLCVLWSDVLDACPDIFFLEDTNGERILFELDASDTQLAEPLVVKRSRQPYFVIPKGVSPDGEDSVGQTVIDIYAIFEWQRRIKAANPDLLTQTTLTAEYHIATIKERMTFDLDDELSKFREKSSLNPQQLDVPHEANEFALPRLFLALPSNLKTWDKRDPSTHKFHCYFLCDFQYSTAYDIERDTEEPPSQLEPRHLHLSNHPGYPIDRPREFFRQFGVYALTILETVRDGHIDEHHDYEIPSLQTFEILRSCQPHNDTQTLHHQLTPQTIRPLVDKAIAYIHQLLDEKSAPAEPSSTTPTNILKSFTKKISAHFQKPKYELVPRKWMLAPDTRKLRTFLNLKNFRDDDDGVGGLYRTLYISSCLYTRWFCPDHALERCDLATLQEFVRVHGGIVNLQQGTLTLSLNSSAHCRAFLSALASTKHIFDLRLDLRWSLTLPELSIVLQQLMQCRIGMLQIDGGSLDSLHRYPPEYTKDLIVSNLKGHRQRAGQYIQVLNYPRPSEQYIYSNIDGFFVAGFAFANLSDVTHIGWKNIQKDLRQLSQGLKRRQTDDDELVLDIDAYLADLTDVLSEFLAAGLMHLDFFDDSTYTFGCRFVVERGGKEGTSSFSSFSPSAQPSFQGIQELCLPFNNLSTDWTHRGLQRIILRPEMGDPGRLLAVLAMRYPGMNEIVVPAQEKDVFRVIKSVASEMNNWFIQSREYTLTLFEYDADGTASHVAKIRADTPRYEAGGFGSGSDETTAEVLEWTYTHILAGSLKNADVHVLDLASRLSRNTLESLVLDISELTTSGLASMKRVLHQSDLETLHINCVSIRGTVQKRYILMLLLAVQWNKLKYLKLYGESIDDWVQLWAKHGGEQLTGAGSDIMNVHIPRLQSFTIENSEGAPRQRRKQELYQQTLCHASALFLHNIISTCPMLMEFKVLNLQMQNRHDWELIGSALELACAVKYVVVNYGANCYANK